MRPYVKLYKSGDHIAISTNVIDEAEFLRLASERVGAMVGEVPEDAEAGTYWHLWKFLPHIVDICCKMRGYKAPTVDEQRVLISGHLPPREEDEITRAAVEKLIAESAQAED